MVDHCARLMGHCPLCPMTNVCIASGDNGMNRWGTNPLRRLLRNAPDACYEYRAPASMKGWRSGSAPPQLRTQTSDDVRWPPQIKHPLALSDVRSRRSEPSLARWLTRHQGRRDTISDDQGLLGIAIAHPLRTITGCPPSAGPATPLPGRCSCPTGTSRHHAAS
jgi:hypothetical protein